MKQVGMYKYLRTLVTEDGRDEKEIKARKAMAREAFNNLERVLRDTQLYKPVRLNILNCYVWSMLRYASEAWTISKDSERRLNAFEMWCCQARRYVIFSGGGGRLFTFVPFSCLMPSFSLSSQNFLRGAMPSRHFFWGGGKCPPVPPVPTPLGKVDRQSHQCGSTKENGAARTKTAENDQGIKTSIY